MGVSLITLCQFKCLLRVGTGLLIGATINRAPEGLFGAAISDSGVEDYLKVCSGTF
jgi:hypothetical protein